MIPYGRNPSDCKLTFCTSVIIGETMQEALDKRDRMAAVLKQSVEVKLAGMFLSQRHGLFQARSGRAAAGAEDQRIAHLVRGVRGWRPGQDFARNAGGTDRRRADFIGTRRASPRTWRPRWRRSAVMDS